MKKRHDNAVRVSTRLAKIAAVVAASTLALSACSGGSTASPESKTQDLGKLRVIQSITHDLTMGGVEVAQLLDLYPDTLKVEIITGTQTAQALATKDVDIGVAAPTRIIGAMLEGLEVTMVAPTIDVWDQYIVASKDFGATKVEDLKGATFGTSTFGSASDYTIRKMADVLGWTKDDYKIVTMGDINGLVAGLKNGTIDALLWGSFTPFQLEAEGYATVLGSARDLIGPAPLDVIAVRNEVLESRPEAVKAFCEGVHAANRTMQEDPKKALQIFTDWGLDPVILPAALEAGLPYLSTSSEITDEMLTNLVDATKFTVANAADLNLEQMKGMYKNCDEL